MIGRLFHRRRSRSAMLLEAPFAGVARMREALPGAGLADIFAELAARTGVDLSDVADRVVERVGEVISRAGAEAEVLADSDRARQLRDLAGRAGEHAELAYRLGAERLLEAIPERQHRSHRGLILLSAGVGLAIGGAVAYFLLARPAERRPSEQPTEPTSTEGGEGAPLAEPVDRAITHAAAPAQGLLSEIQHRLTLARRAARAAQTATERRLWREYRSGAQ